MPASSLPDCARARTRGTPGRTWLAFAIYLHLRRFHGWRGNRAAVVLLTCFALAMLSLFGISLLTSTLHSGYFS